MKKIVLCTTLFTTLALTSCQKITHECEIVQLERKEEVNTIYTSMYPLYYVTKELTDGTGVTVENVLPDDANIHDYNAKPTQISGIEDADLFVAVGEGFEPYVENLHDGGSAKLLQTMCYEGLLAEDEHDEHQEESSHGHSHEFGDPHYFTSPKRMIELASAYKDSLIQLFPESLTSKIEQNYVSLNADLVEVNNKYETQLESSLLDTEHFVVTHNAFSYLEIDYHLHQTYILDSSDSTDLSAAERKEIQDHMVDEGITKVLYEENIICLPAPHIIQAVNNLSDANEATVEPYKVYFRNFTSKNKDDAEELTLIEMYEENLNALLEVLIA